ncbi:MAG: glycosyl hydrolase family 18 protein [Myxococcaceae bacterium]
MRRNLLVALGLAVVVAGVTVAILREGDESTSHQLPPAPPPAPSAKRQPWTTPEPESALTMVNPQNTSLWLRRQWLHTDVTASEVKELASALQANGVTRVYPFLGGMNESGVPGWRSLGVHRAFSQERISTFTNLLHAADPSIEILPWTGGVPGRDFKWGNATQLAAFVAQMKTLTDHGANGVHLNMEPVASDDMGFLSLVRDVRAALPKDKSVSIAAVAPRNDRISMSPERYWSPEYLKALCEPADEIVIMGYDTWLTDRSEYERVVAEWTAQLAALLPTDAEHGCIWRMGVPTYDDDMPHHKLDVERIDVALRGVKAGLASAKSPGGFAGIALYSSWTTDEQEWAAYDALWLGRKSGSVVITEPVR